MLVPTLTLLLIFNYYPAFMGLYRSFFEWDVGLEAKFVGLENFRQLLVEDEVFLQSLANVGLLTIWHVISGVTIPFFVAELIFNIRNQMSQYVYRILMILPAVVPGIVTLLLWRFIYDGTHGLLNDILAAIGLGSMQQPWLGNPDTALYAVMFMGFPWVGGVTVLIYLAGLQNISHEIFDSAQIDGCSGLRRLRSIDVPLISSQFKLIVILTIIGSLRSWIDVFVMTRGGPGTASMVPGLWMYNNAFVWGKMGYASAIGMILFILIFIFTLINNKYIKTEM
jgi:raffinose/stachyose/melibiose transport system permease protein